MRESDKLKDYTIKNSQYPTKTREKREAELFKLIVARNNNNKAYQLAEKELINRHKKYEKALNEKGYLKYHLVDTRHLKEFNELIEIYRKELLNEEIRHSLYIPITGKKRTGKEDK